MRKLFTSTFLFLSLIIVLFFSCKKTDSAQEEPAPPVDRFFSAPSNAPNEIKLVAKTLEKQNDQFNYLSSITKKAGYPRWDKARVVNFEKGLVSKGEDEMSGEVVYIPFVRDSDNYVNSLLAVKMKASDTVYRMLYDYNYRAFGYDTTDRSKWSARDVFNLFTSFDNAVFGHTVFWIRDANLFRPANDSLHVIATRASSRTNTASGRVAYYSITECASYQVCSSSAPPPVNPKPALAKQSSDDCATVEICTTYYYGGGGDGSTTGSTGTGYIGWTGTGDGTGGGGTGGSTGWYSGGESIPCASAATQRSSGAIQPIDGCGSGWTAVTTNPTPTITDPCADAKPASDAATVLSQNSNFSNAKTNIQTASSDNKEHSITFGKDASGNITTSPIDNGTNISGTVNTTWPGAFADIHNHPDPVVPSPGDFYGLVSLNENHSNWATRFVVTPDGSVYALAVIDLAKASAFKNLYPADQVPGYPPTFPGVVCDDLAEAKSYIKNVMGLSSLISDEMAMAFVLEKYDTGIALLKQDSNGNFKRLRTIQTTSNGTLTYTANNCQ
jgi:hypothetical protein